MSDDEDEPQISERDRELFARLCAECRELVSMDDLIAECWRLEQASSVRWPEINRLNREISKNEAYFEVFKELFRDMGPEEAARKFRRLQENV